MKNVIKIAFGAAVLIVIIAGIWFWSSAGKEVTEPTPITSDYILFFGTECPHCKDLEEWIVKNGIGDKFKFDSLEVWHNKPNAAVFKSKLEECKVPQDQWGVPFFYAKGECFSGTPKIEEFLKKQVES